MITTLSSGPARFSGGLREVAPDTYAWLQPNGGLGESNAGLIVGSGESMLVDTLWDHPLTERMLAAMADPLAEAPLTRVLNSHSDGDHWWGNHVVPAGAEIVTCEIAARAMRKDVAPRELALMAKAFKAGARLPGGLAEPLRDGAQRFGPFDFGGVRLRYPDRTFRQGATFDVGGREARATVVGPAHSPGDTIVHVPDVDIVFAADVLFVGATPIMWTGPAENWIAAGELLLELDAEKYVPGHGDVGTRADVERIRDYWTFLRDKAGEHHAHESSRGSAARAILADPDFAWGDWDEPERIVANLDAIYRHLEGRGPVGARGPARVQLMREIAVLAAERAR